MRVKKISLIFIAIFVLVSARALAFEPYRGYNYDSTGNAVYSPNGFTVDDVLSGERMGAGRLNSPRDLFVDRVSKEIYIADTGNNRIIVLDYNYRMLREYRKFNNNGSDEFLNNPHGIFVHSNGFIYIADRDNSRVLVVDKAGNVINSAGKPDTDLISEGQPFYPEKIVVDSVGRLYIQAYGIYQGLICIDENGSFLQYFGSNKVEMSAALIAEQFWRSIATRDQKSAMISFVPIEYSNIFIDNEDFIYATVKKSQNSKEEIRKLNPVSNDILNLKRSSSLASDNFGDYDVIESDDNIIIDSSFIDVCVDEIGLIYGLDVTRGRIFVYDQERSPLMIFGGLGRQKGLLETPASIELVEENAVVLDSKKNSITVYQLTEFGKNVKEAVRLFNDGKYEEAREPWLDIIRMNTNFEMAYIGLGKVYFGEQKYKEAMNCFKLGNDRIGYSDAYNEYRKEVVRENFYYLFTAIIIVALIVWLFLKAKDRRKKEGRSLSIPQRWEKLLYTFYIIVHPFDGYEGIKFYNKGSLTVSYGILTIWFLLSIIKSQATGFLFNYSNIENINILSIFAGTIGVFILWIVANWALCTLLDGEGTFGQIFIASTYALIPYIIITVPGLILSNILVLGESVYLSILYQGSILWCGLLLLIGMLTIHQYTFKSTIKTMAFTVLGMGIIVFIGLLAFSLYQQVSLFISNIYNEIMFRI